MNREQFLHRCPTLWHVGPAGSWDGIKQLGLRTSQQLIQAADLSDDERTDLLTKPRPESVTINIGDLPVTLRDQAPLMKRKDLESLMDDGMTVADWIGMLNRRVFLFTDRAAMDKVRAKYVEQDGAQDVITFSPMSLYDSCRHRLELAAQNTGAVQRLRGRQKRLDTFLSGGQFPDRRPAEVTIANGLDLLEVASTIAFVERHHADGTSEKLPR